MTNTKEIVNDENNQIYFEKMRYNNNSLSYKLGLGAIVCSLIAMFLSFNSLNPKNVGTLVKILLNIIIFLYGFLACEKVKVYQRKYSYVMFGLSAACVARIFWYPLSIIRYYHKFQAIFDGTKKSYDEAAAKYSKNLGASMIGKFVVEGTDANGNAIGHYTTSGYLTANGYVRGIVIIAFLVAAAALFVGSALVNIKKSKELETYLDSIGQKK